MAEDVTTRAQELIRAGRIDDAIAMCTAALATLPADRHRTLHTTLGLACWYGQRWPEALAWFRRAAADSQVPEDWNALLDRIAPDLDEPGKASCEELRATWR